VNEMQNCYYNSEQDFVSCHYGKVL